MRKLKRALFFLTVLAVLSLVLRLTVFNGNAYVGDNEALLRSLPVYPGAARVSLASSPCSGPQETDSPIAYTTAAQYRVPKGTLGGKVARFYFGRMEKRGWKGVIWHSTKPDRRLTGPNSFPWGARFTSGEKRVVFGTGNLGYPRRTYDVYVDARHGSHPHVC
jgi:hypothetical protein